MNDFVFYIREEDGCATREISRGMRRGRSGLRRGTMKRNQEEEQDEEIRIRLSDKRYVSCCIIEDSSLTFYGLFSYCLQMDGTWRTEK